MDDQLSRSQSSANALLQTSIVFEDKLKKVTNYSETEKVFLKTIFMESREILDTVEAVLDTEIMSMQKYVSHLQSIPDPKEEFYKLKYDGLLNEICTMLEGTNSGFCAVYIFLSDIV